MAGPLDGIHVVELAGGLQGPAAAGLFADLGAVVVKVEPPEGDTSRFHRGVNNFTPDGTPGAQFIASARGKRSVTLDIHSELGREVVYRLIDRSDVFVSNYRADALERMGVGYEAVKGRNPQIIYGVASGFGPKGPEALKGMVDGAAQARGGIVNLTGNRGGPAMMPGAILADLAGAMQLALGIMTALYAREKTGAGQKVETSAYGAQIWMQAWEITQSSLIGRSLERDGCHPNSPGSSGNYRTADGKYLHFAFPRDEASWQSFWRFAGRPDVAFDERWNSTRKRTGAGNDPAGEVSKQVRPLLTEAFAQKTIAEWTAFLDTEPEIVYNRVFDYDDVLADPQALENEYIITREVPMIGRQKVPGQPIHFSATPGIPAETIPELGADTELVMTELGFGWDEIEHLNDLTRQALRRKFAAVGEESPY